MHSPMISVIMSTYNTPLNWLEESISSILVQSFSDFEFLIVDDCSSVSIQDIQAKFSYDPRIIWIRNKKNLGLTKSLNIALKQCRGKFIARMDADDISLPQRFKVQVDYLNSHPDVIVCGTYRRAIGIENRDEVWNIPVSREEQQVVLFFYNCGLTHPTAMFRKSMLDEYNISYNENYLKAQDYGIWVQCTRYAPMAMIPQVLLQYRKSEMQITAAQKDSVKSSAALIRLDQVRALGIEPTDKQARLHELFCLGKQGIDAEELIAWTDLLIDTNNSVHYFDKSRFEKEIDRRLYQYSKNEYKQLRNKTYKNIYRTHLTIKFIFDDGFLVLKQLIKKFISRK